MTTLLWFRLDLRVADNPALMAAISLGQPIVPVYIDALSEEAPWAPGGASRWWLHHSLERLQEDLQRIGLRLTLRRATDSGAELQGLAVECGATAIVWNRRYEPAIVARDAQIKQMLQAHGLRCASYNAALLHEPWDIANKAGRPFQVFTPFWRHCLAQAEPAEPQALPERLRAPPQWPRSCELGELGLLPKIDWAGGLRDAWQPGSAAAHATLQHFLAEIAADYDTSRDRPDVAGTSRLSPHLHFGEIGPREIWAAVRRHALAAGRHSSWRQSRFLTELGWREFAYHLLYHFPRTPQEPLRGEFARFPWRDAPHALQCWQRGLTGYPIVDAGMRQLWHSGWMHNRVRMICGSFLVKDLLQPWSAGAHWFFDTLVDADLASNTLGWQWIAGCGADAAPYFRIFNPTMQGEKFDPDGVYVRRWLPALAQIPAKWLHRPWEAPLEVLAAAGVQLGVHYPKPIIDHAVARGEALSALATLKQGGAAPV